MNILLFYLQVSTRGTISKDLFLLFERLLFLVFPSYLVLCSGEGALISEGPTHPYQWQPFIWRNWKCMHFLLRRMGKSKDGKPKLENQLSWNVLLLLGKETLCSLRYWITLERGRKWTRILGLYQTIVNSYINYIAWKKMDGPAIIEKHLLKVQHFIWYTCWTLYTLSVGINSENGFLLSSITQLLS